MQIGWRDAVHSGESTMYYSEKVEGMIPRTTEKISETLWDGICATIQARIDSGSFHKRYPGHSVYAVMRAEIPRLPEIFFENGLLSLSFEDIRSLDILDMIEFCWKYIMMPIRDNSYYGQSEQEVIESAREEFREEINVKFRRKGSIYNLAKNGEIKCVVNPILREIINYPFETGDTELNRRLESAVEKFLDSDENVQRESLDDLWDAWEYITSLGEEKDKKARIRLLLDQSADSTTHPGFRQILEEESLCLGKIGNNHGIRHKGREQETLAANSQVRYLFHRLFCLINLVKDHINHARADQ